MNSENKIIGDGDIIGVIGVVIILSIYVGIMGLYLGWW